MHTFGIKMDPRIQRHPLGYLEVVEKPDRAALRYYYAEKYFQQEAGNYRTTYSAEELNYIENKLVQKRARVEAIRGAGRGRLLDVGCGEGFALAHFLRAGWEVEGLDYSSADVKAMNPGCENALHCGDVMELMEEKYSRGETYDLIWITNVLEHLPDPPAMMRIMRSLVGNGGLAVITVPNDFSALQKRIIDAGQVEHPYWVAIPDHLAYFDRDSLLALAQDTGWRCHDVLADFPIDWFLFHPGSNYVRDRTAGGGAHRARIAIENLVGAQPVNLVNNFYSAMAAVGFGCDITAFLSPAGK